MSFIIVTLFYFYSNRPYIQIDIVSNNSLNSLKNIQVIEEAFVVEKDKQVDMAWKLSIPKINLEAEISEGTDKNTMDYFIGHFTETEIFNGNVGLASHNRGYRVNYFSRIKELETGDEIYYSYNGNTRKYKVVLSEKIDETNWNYLENTNDNRITLITCVENEPEYRRCIQGIEIKEE